MVTTLFKYCWLINILQAAIAVIQCFYKNHLGLRGPLYSAYFLYYPHKRDVKAEGGKSQKI